MTGNDLVVFQRTARGLGAILLPDNAQWELRMHVKSQSSNKLYVVARNKQKQTWGCDCMGWKRHRHCKHLDTMRPALMAANRPAAVAPEPTPSPAAKPAPVPVVRIAKVVTKPAMPVRFTSRPHPKDSEQVIITDTTTGRTSMVPTFALTGVQQFLTDLFG